MARLDTNTEYLNASAGDFSDKVQTLLRTEREVYELLKAAKANVLEAVKAEMPTAPGREIKGTTYTRWGQWQIVVGDKPQAKQTATGQRKTLAEYRAELETQGRSH